jgi:hypothetical protein
LASVGFGGMKSAAEPVQSGVAGCFVGMAYGKYSRPRYEVAPIT